MKSVMPGWLAAQPGSVTLTPLLRRSCQFAGVAFPISMRVAMLKLSLPRSAHVALTLVAVLSASFAGSATAAPRMNKVSLRGLQIGQPTQIEVSGSELSADSLAVMPIPLTSQRVMPGATPSRITLEIVVDPSAASGIYPLWIANGNGISSAVAVGVDALPQQPFSDRIERLPIALHGTLAGAQILKTTFSGMAGQRVVVDVESQRLGAKLNPVVRLNDHRGRQLAWSPKQEQIAGDARCEVILPADGDYTVELHDTLYRGANPGFFRLKVGALDYADLVLPLGVQRGTAASMTPIATSLAPASSTEFEASATDFRARQPASVPSTAALTGRRPVVVVSDMPEVVESSSGERPQRLPAPPVAISATLSEPGEEDVFLLPVEPGKKLRFDVLANRVGSPLDGVLMIRGERGNQLARNDDQPGTPDPGLEFRPPGDTSLIQIAVSDLLKQGGAAFVYRISIEPADRADFSLKLDRDLANVPAGATIALPVVIERRNFGGPIRLEVENLPEGVEVTGAEIPASATRGLLAFSATGSATGPALLRVLAHSDGLEPRVTRVARVPDPTGVNHSPWFADDLGFAVGPPAAIAIALADSPGESPFPGERFPLKVAFHRAPGAAGKVRLRLLSTQEMPRKKVKENNQEKQVDDVDRALRLDGEPVFGPDQQEAVVDVLVPADLPITDWGLALQAETLSPDEKSVVATTTTRVFYRRPQRPFTIDATDGAGQDVEARAGEGETGKLIGTIERATGYDKPVAVTLTGLPDGYPAPRVEVPANQATFELQVRFPAEAKPAELKNVQLVAEAKCDFSTENGVVRSNPIPIGVIRVVAGEPK